MTKGFIKRALGVTTDAELAEALGIKRTTVVMWGTDDALIPTGRQYEIKTKRPDKFWNVAVVPKESKAKAS